MKLDSKILALIEDVRSLARDWRCPEGLPEMAQVSGFGSPKERVNELKDRLFWHRPDSAIEGHLRTEIMRIYYVGETMKHINNAKDMWHSVRPVGVTETCQREDILFVLDTLQAIAENVLEGFPPDTRVDPTMRWLLGIINKEEPDTSQSKSTQPSPDANQDQDAPPHAPEGVRKKASPQRRTRGAITQAEMAQRCDVSVRTIQNWDAGSKTPDGYPGRARLAPAIAWAVGYVEEQRMLNHARQMNRATPTDPQALDQQAYESALD